MDRLLYSFEIVKSTFKIVLTNPKLIFFAILSSICSIAVAGAFLIPLLFLKTEPVSSQKVSTTVEASVSDDGDISTQPADPIANKLDQASAWAARMKKNSQEHPVAFYSYLFLFYFCLYFVSVFFNTAIISCVIKAFSGERPSLREGFGTALSLAHYLAGWVLISSTVGLVLSVIQNRSNKFGEITAGIVGFIWSIATCFIVPVMAVERIGPLAAFDHSFDMMKKTWGENIVGEVSFGIIFAVLRFLWIVILGVGLLMGGSMILTFFILSLLYLFFVEMLSILVEPVFLAALYLYARDGQISEGFEAPLLQGSFSPAYQV